MQSHIVGDMDARDRRALKAIADYLRDYCGEEAVRRWLATLTERERAWLTRPSDPVQDAWKQSVDAVADLLRFIADVAARFMDVLAQALAAVWEALAGPSSKWLGGDAL